MDHSPYSEHTFRDNHFIFCQDGVSAYYTDVTVTNLTVCDMVNNIVNLGSSTITVTNVTTRCNRLVNMPVGDSGNDADERAQVGSFLGMFGNHILVVRARRGADAWEAAVDDPNAFIGQSGIFTRDLNPAFPMTRIQEPVDLAPPSFTVVPVPEPSVMGLWAIGVLGLAWARWVKQV